MKKTNILSLLLVLFGLALVTGCTPNTDTPEVPEETTYTVTIASGIENGTVSTDKTSAKAGETVKLTVTPNDGYQLGSLTVVDSSSNAITTTSNTFTMPDSNVTVDATFTEIPKVEYTVTYSSEYGRAPASITVTENTILTAEQLPELSIEGKTFGGWFDGDTKAEAGKYKVTKTVTLTAKWTETTPEPAPEEDGNDATIVDDDSNNEEENTPADTETTPTLYSITIAGVTNGTVSASKTSKIAAGETITLTVTSETGYELDTLSVKNGDTEITVTNNQFTMPAGNVTVSATFKEIIREYTVSYLFDYDDDGLSDYDKPIDRSFLDGKLSVENNVLSSIKRSPNEWKEFFEKQLSGIYIDIRNTDIYECSYSPASDGDEPYYLDRVEIINKTELKLIFK